MYNKPKKSMWDRLNPCVDMFPGMKEWMSAETEQLDKYNKESIPFIRSELEYAYTDSTHKTLDDFFKHSSVDGANASKRANIGTAPDAFTDVGKVRMLIL